MYYFLFGVWYSFLVRTPSSTTNKVLHWRVWVGFMVHFNRQSLNSGVVGLPMCCPQSCGTGTINCSTVYVIRHLDP